MNARDTTPSLRVLIAQQLDSVEDATAQQIIIATGLRDYPSRVIQELNAMRADGLIEADRKGKAKDLAYWLAVPIEQIINATPETAPVARRPSPFDLPDSIGPGTRAAQIWSTLRPGVQLTTREIASALKCTTKTLDPTISGLYKSKTIARTKGTDRVYRYHRPHSDQPQPAVGQNTGSDGSGSPSEDLLPEAVAVPEKTATEALASLPPEPDPVLLAAANRMLHERMEGVAHALRGSGLPGLAEVTGCEDLQPHVAALTGAYQMERGAAYGRGAAIDVATEELAAALENVTGVESDDMCLEALAEVAANELRNLRALAHKLEAVLHSKTHECDALRAYNQPQSHQGLCASEINSFAVLAAKRPLRRFYARDRAVESAMRAAANGSGRAEVFALVPIGRAVRGAEWRDA